MLNIGLCDDDKNILEYYSNRINNLLNSFNYFFKIDIFTSGENLIFNLEDNPNQFDIIIIDVVMKNLNGIEAAKLLRKYGYRGIIIFLTSSEEFAFESFKVEPLNYILKNDADKRFDSTLLKAVLEVNNNSKKSIVLNSRPKNKIIDIESIVYMESLNKKVIVHKFSGDKEEVNYSFKDIYEKVREHGFIQCHKSYIVNIKYIENFNKLECGLQKNIIIPVGRKYSKSFRKVILDNEFNSIII